MTLAAVAAALRVNQRTAKRYLAELSALGKPLQRQQTGEGRTLRYGLSKSEEGIPAALLRALAKARDELRAGGNAKHARTVEQALQQLEGTEAKREQDSVNWDDIYTIDHGPLAEADPDRALLERLEKAIAIKRTVKLDYLDANGVASTRLFNPWRIYLRVGVLYLVGNEPTKPDIIIPLRVQRIKRCISQSDSFIPPPFDALSLYRYSFGQWIRRSGQNPENVVLEIREEWLKGHLQATRFEPVGKISMQDGKTVFKLKVILHPDFENWVMSLIPAAIPLEPAHLVKAIATRLNQGLKNTQLS